MVNNTDGYHFHPANGSPFTVTRHLSLEESRRHGRFPLFWPAGLAGRGLGTGPETLLPTERIQSAGPERRCIDGAGPGGCSSLGLVALEKHWRSSHAGLGAGGPSEKRRSILFLRSRTKPGFT